MNDLQATRLSDLKRQASLLLKEFRNKASPETAQPFLKLKFFRDRSAEWLLEHSSQVRLKHAYWVVALQNGFSDWGDLKRTVTEKDCLYRPCCVSLVWAWFSGYREALAYFEKHGGYLLSFWKDYIVCGPEYIRCTGLDPDDENWERIARNWVFPKDPAAWQLLKEQAHKLYLSQQ